MGKKKVVPRQIEIRTYTSDGGLIKGLLLEKMEDSNVVRLNRMESDREKIVNEWVVNTKSEQTELALSKLGWLKPGTLQATAIAMDRAHDALVNNEPELAKNLLIEAMEAMQQEVAESESEIAELESMANDNT